MDAMKKILSGKTVLVTGGTGFLGRALVEELLNYDVQSIRVFSRDELKHHEVQEKFEKNPRIRNLVGDVRDYDRLNEAVKGADIVIHAAAMKRIDLIEYNVAEAIKTNVIGTMNVARSCIENNVEKAVFVSTDKACSPVNSYGATKMLGERVFIESNYSKGESKTALISVRYGNVLESTGSVIPYFVDKIKKGEEIPLTDDRMTRFIITPKRSVQLIFEAIEHGVGGELFVPKLDSLSLVGLIDLLQEHYKGKSKVKTVGIRPGEKIHEELLNAEECRRAFELNDNYVVLSQIDHYQKNVKYPYLNGKKPVGFSKYGSEDFVADKAKLKKLLENAKVLN